MNIIPIKTHPIIAHGATILQVLDRYVPQVPEKSVIAITSKIVSLCEGSVAAVATHNKDRLIEGEADYYLPKEFNKYGFHFSITNNTMIASAGIDESNGNGNYVLWPRNPQKSANEIREHLIKKFGLKRIGVIIVDSKTFPLRWGTVGTAIAHSGFEALNDYIGTKDLFDYEMRVAKANVSEGLAASSVLVMGEGAESTPIAIIEDLPFVKFQDRNPTEEELKKLVLTMDEDLYAPILNAVPWKKGKKN